MGLTRAGGGSGIGEALSGNPADNGILLANASDELDNDSKFKYVEIDDNVTLDVAASGGSGYVLKSGANTVSSLSNESGADGLGVLKLYSDVDNVVHAVIDGRGRAALGSSTVSSSNAFDINLDGLPGVTRGYQLRDSGEGVKAMWEAIQLGGVPGVGYMNMYDANTSAIHVSLIGSNSFNSRFIQNLSIGFDANAVARLEIQTATGKALLVHGSAAGTAICIEQKDDEGTTHFTVDDSGLVNTDNDYHVLGTKVLGAQQAAVIDATDAASAITQLNALLARVRTHGLIVT